jgi:phage repressor protein C with HTH and peptisase S24 domain
MTQQTIGQKLSALRGRSGLSLEAVARLGGYKGPSSVQVYFGETYDPSHLDVTVAAKLAKAMVGKGSPPITRAEVMALTGVAIEPEVSAPFEDVPTLKGQPKDVPVFGSALAADIEFDAASGAPSPVEQTMIDMAGTIAFVRRPPGIDADRKVYVVFVAGHSMEPRYRPGDPVFVDPARPPAIGDDVIVQLADPDADGNPQFTCGLIKTLARRSASYVELDQYQPELRFSVPAARIASIHRIIPWREAFGI